MPSARLMRRSSSTMTRAPNMPRACMSWRPSRGPRSTLLRAEDGESMHGHARQAQRWLILVAWWLVGSLLILRDSAAAWQGAQDNKSPAELAQMAEFKLAGEGRKACAAVALAQAQHIPQAQQTVEEAHGYLGTLAQRAQQIH